MHSGLEKFAYPFSLCDRISADVTRTLQYRSLSFPPPVDFNQQLCGETGSRDAGTSRVMAPLDPTGCLRVAGSTRRPSICRVELHCERQVCGRAAVVRTVELRLLPSDLVFSGSLFIVLYQRSVVNWLQYLALFPEVCADRARVPTGNCDVVRGLEFIFPSFAFVKETMITNGNTIIGS